MKQKSKVVLNLAVLSIPDKVSLAAQLKAASTNNASLKGSGEIVPLLDAKAVTLQKSYNAAQAIRNESITQTAVMNQHEDELDALLNKFALTVEAESEGDPALIKSAGLQVRRTASKAGIPSLPQALSAKEGLKEGSIALKWKSVQGSRSFLIRATTTVSDPASWQQVAVSTKANVEVSGLESGKQYWFQVCAIGSSGQGPWSDPATRVVP